MVEVALFLYLLQIQNPDAPRLPVSRGSQQMEQSQRRFRMEWETSSDPADPMKQERADEEREFARRFNGLIDALSDFSSSYNAGHVINAKKAKAVRKALREFEQSDWFRRSKED
jgi:hypothetical protein